MILARLLTMLGFRPPPTYSSVLIVPRNQVSQWTERGAERCYWDDDRHHTDRMVLVGLPEVRK